MTNRDLRATLVHEQPLWIFIMHLISHGMQQLSEAAVLLTRAGHSPGDIGFLEYLQSRGR